MRRRLDGAFLERQYAVDRCQDRRAMSDQEDGGAFALGIANGTDQCLLAHVVKIRIGFIENEQLGLTIERSRQRHALLLTAGESVTRASDPGRIARGQATDKLMDARAHRRLDRNRGIVIPHPPDVVEDSAVKQRYRLWKIADAAAELDPLPFGRRHTVEQHRSGAWRKDSGNETGEAGLPGARGTDNADRLAGLDHERELAEDRLGGAGRGKAQAIDDKPSLTIFGCRARLRLTRPEEEIAHTSPCCERCSTLPPSRDEPQRAG